MALLWQYFILRYCKVAFLSMGALIILLFTMRLDEVAHFACLGADSLQLFLFLALQLSLLIPIALPLGSLIASYSLFRSLHSLQELTALRAAGISLWSLLAPLIAVATLLGSFNFFFASEVATRAQIASVLLREKLRNVNPLLLLHSNHLLRLYGMYYEERGQTRYGEYVKNALLALPDKNQTAILLFVAEEARNSSEGLLLHNCCLIGSQQKGDKRYEDGFFPLVVENVFRATSLPNALGLLLTQKKSYKQQPDYLCLPLLFDRWQKLKAIEKRAEALSEEDFQANQKEQKKLLSELPRRFSLALAPPVLTLLGATFAIEPPRHRQKRQRIWLVLTALGLLLSYFFGKACDDYPLVSSAIYLGGYPTVFMVCLLQLNRIKHGLF